jgi:hypothetical protein
MNQSLEQLEAPALKGGGVTLTFAIIFLVLLAYPIVAVILRDYESDMAMTTVFLGGPCFVIGTISGLIGLARGHRRCKLALVLMWIPFVLIVVLAVVGFALGWLK